MAAGRVVVFGWAESIHTRRWVEGMASRGFRVKLISLGGRALPGVETVIHRRAGRRSYLLCAGAAAREARDFGPDLVHVHYATGFGLWGLAARHAPTLVSVWGTDVEAGAPRWFLRPLVRKVLRRAAWISATSEYLKRRAVHLVPEAAEKITVIPFGVTVGEKPPAFPADDTIRICFMKSHRRVSGPDILLKAMAEVVTEIPNVRLSIAGSGRMTPHLKRLVRSCNLEDRVSFVGHLEPDEVGRFLEGHHFMVMPSRRESFGVAALEAAACGRPVIASDVGGVPEVVRHDHTGILVPAGDVDRLALAIVELSRDAQRRQRLGGAAFEFARAKYPWEKSLDMMSSLYERLIDES
ncbi:MAG TPA: glycosyltransferase family 4 protein [Acidobacteriota bacterium]|nr:glycosyltransferase family 4 protein [Acidobacteriota bacterium]